MLKKQAYSKSASHIFGDLYLQVENGQYLSAGMNKFKKIFGDFAVNIVRVGEVSGTLSENLNYLAEELKKKQELKRKVVSALVYPILIVFATIGITVMLVAYVFPKILPIFQSFKAQLPWSTRILIAISNGFSHYWQYILLGVIVFIAAGYFLLRQHKVRLWFDRNVLRLPLLGPLFLSYQVTNFTRTLGLLLKSDVKIVEALQIVASTMSNKAYKKEFNFLAEKTTRGEKISSFMEKDTKLFPPIISQMVAVGEATGNLSGSLLYLADMYEDDLNNLTRNLTTSIEPVLMIFMGLLVGFIAISIITPIYGITQNLRP
jgi:type IV pilus assembly protein PilC